ncbi:30S ribosomal protein S5 [bacterium]|nr:30S ribosomal protein S5 [bacterium]
MKPKIDTNAMELKDRVVKINRVAKVVKGGRRFKFSSLVVVGDGQGTVGFGLGKANEVPASIAKGVEEAKKNMIKIPMRGTTITHAIIGRFGAARVMMKPASHGTGVIAGGAVRAVMDVAGVHDVLTKIIGTNNHHNVLYATFEGFKTMLYEEEVLRLRGKLPGTTASAKEKEAAKA